MARLPPCFDRAPMHHATLTRLLRWPCLLVLDDLHWSDRGTLLFLRHFVRSARAGSLLVVGLYRDTELGRQHPLADLLADLRRDRVSERISLNGLSLSETTALVEARTGHTPPERFAHQLYEETEGNPFFVEEVLNHLTETGSGHSPEAWSDGMAGDDFGISEGVREVIGRRLSRLSDDANLLLANDIPVGPGRAVLIQN